MARLLTKPDRVALFGSVIGTGSLLAGWLTLRPNRLASGEGLSLWSSFGVWEAALLAALWIICLFFSFTGQRLRRPLSLGMAANVIIILTLVFTGTGADRLMQNAPEIARVSIGGGAWVTLAGAYAVVYSARQGLEDKRILRQLLTWSAPAILVILLASGWFNHISILQEFDANRQRFWQEALQHVRLFGISVVAAAVIGIPLGVWATRNAVAERPVFFITNIMQTVPSLALFGILIAPLSALSFAYPWLRELGIRGVGVAPAIIALVIYSLLPVVRNTYVGIRRVDPAAVDAGAGMGMSRWQIFRRVEAPLAAPLTLEGIRTASVQAVGLTAVAALIGAGGLGWFIFQGIGQAAPDLIILGAIPIIVMALVVDGVMRAVVRAGTPRGLDGGT
jgi:osmoprotectant transport system permease protein